MGSKNTSDNIEEYIKNLLAQAGIAELKRSEVADFFQVVPSQINYVIKTRFTESRGYIVESKRGGGGYIRIGKIEYSDHHQMLNDFIESIGERVSEQVFDDLLMILLENKLLSQREVNFFASMTQDHILGEDAAGIRARILKELLKQMDRKGL